MFTFGDRFLGGVVHFAHALGTPRGMGSWGRGLHFTPRDRPCVACATTFLPHLKPAV